MYGYIGAYILFVESLVEGFIVVENLDQPPALTTGICGAGVIWVAGADPNEGRCAINIWMVVQLGVR